MSDVDISKLKVAELRAELQHRGLETKGVKAILAERLRTAIEEEQADGVQEEPEEVEYPSFLIRVRNSII